MMNPDQADRITEPEEGIGPENVAAEIDEYMLDPDTRDHDG